MNFEIIDNLFQVTVLACAVLVAVVHLFRHKDRRCLILALAYACFFMGTLYYVLHLAITGDTPRVFYVAEISWIASWFFFLSLQIMRTEGMKLCVLPVPAVCAGLIAASILIFRFMASYLVSGLFAVPVSAVAYLSLFRLQRGTAHRRTDVCFAVCTALQVGLFFVSAFMEDPRSSRRTRRAHGQEQDLGQRDAGGNSRGAVQHGRRCNLAGQPGVHRLVCQHGIPLCGTLRRNRKQIRFSRQR